jgi:hypothetical protein
MSKRTRFKYQAANQLGTALAVTANKSLTEAEILDIGYQFIKITSTATLTLPAASEELKGITVRVFASAATCKVYVSGGFGGGGTSFDTDPVTRYGITDYWCDGTYWYALSASVTSA